MNLLTHSSLRPSLARHLIAVLLIKIIALFALWHAFVAPQKRTVAASQMAQRIAPIPVLQSPKEVIHDDRFERR